MDVLVRVRLKSDTVHSKFSTAQAGFSLALVNQCFVSNLCKLLVISSPWIHSLLFSSPVSPLFLLLNPSSHSSFIFTWIVPSPLEIQSYKRHPPHSQNPNPYHTRSTQLVSYLLPSHYLLCLITTTYFCLGPELDEDILGPPYSPFFLNIALGPLSSPATSTKHPGWRDTGRWGTPWAGGQTPSSPRLSGIATAPVSFFPSQQRNTAAAAKSGRWRLCREGRVTILQWGTASPYISLSHVLPGWLLRGLDHPAWRSWGSAAVLHKARNWGFSLLSSFWKNGMLGTCPRIQGHPRTFGPLILDPRRLRSCRSPHSHYHHQFPGSIRRQKGCSIFTSSWHLFF